MEHRCDDRYRMGVSNRGSSSALTARCLPPEIFSAGAQRMRAQAAGTHVTCVIIWLPLRAKRIWGQA
jgi:hypothetical protein